MDVRLCDRIIKAFIILIRHVQQISSTHAQYVHNLATKGTVTFIYLLFYLFNYIRPIYFKKTVFVFRELPLLSWNTISLFLSYSIFWWTNQTSLNFTSYMDDKWMLVIPPYCVPWTVPEVINGHACAQLIVKGLHNYYGAFDERLQ